MFRCVFPSITDDDIDGMSLTEFNDHVEWAHEHLKAVYGVKGG